MSNPGRHRYPGAQPFEKEYKNLFFGREKVTADLYRKVKLEQLVVLYSKSGLGKSSLLNAGIIPTAEAEGKYTPIRIRLGAWTERETRTPVQIMLEQVMKAGNRATFLDNLIKNEATLWHEVKEFQITNAQNHQTASLLLIFDQFEELFTYPEAGVIEFKQQLREALFENLPQRYADELEKHFDQKSDILSSEELDILQIQPDLKVILAIRSDRMSLLDGLSDYLPTILKNCFELSALDREEATRAIVEPARIQLKELLTPTFEYSEELIEKILSFLSKKSSQRIESFQLQILCQSIEEGIKTAGQIVTIEDLNDENLGTLYENYYDKQIDRLESEHERMTARALIEDGLIYSIEERRLSLYEGVITEEYNVSKETLQKLVNSHLLRAEPSMQGGGYTYELSHDTLVKPVLMSRRRRRDAMREQNTLLYENLIDQIPETQRLQTRKLIEEDMVFEDRELRILLYESQILKKITPDTLKALLDISLLRGEHSPSAGFQYQLGTPDMVTGVLAAKQKRLEQEAAEAEAAEQERKEREMTDLRLKAAEEERKRQEAEYLKLQAEEARKIAETEKAEADRQRNLADVARTDAETQRDAAEAAKKEADRQRNRASDAQKEAETQRDAAESAKKEAETQRNKAIVSKRRSNIFGITSAILFVGVSILAVVAFRSAEANRQAKQDIIDQTFRTDQMRANDYVDQASTLIVKYPTSAKAFYEQAYQILSNENYSDKEEAQNQLKTLKGKLEECTQKEMQK